MSIPLSEERQEQKSLELDLDELIVSTFERGTTVVFIYGRRNSGKTDFSLLIAEILYDNQVLKHIATNITITQSHFPTEYITSLEDLESWCKNNRGNKLFILDEAGKTIRRRSPMSKLNIEMLDQLQVLRHYSLNFILVAPAEKYIDNAALGSDILDITVNKFDFKTPKVALWVDHMEEQEILLRDIPRTSVGFDTLSVATFQKNSPRKMPRFKDKDMENLWLWSHGSTQKALGVHPQYFQRILKKFVKEIMEKDDHASHFVSGG